MAEEVKRRKSKVRREGEGDTPEDGSSDVTPTVSLAARQPTAPPIAVAPAPEVRDELTVLMQELLLKTHELSFEYSTMECEEINICPLARKSKELFRVVKKLNEIVRKMSPQPPSGYIT